MSDLTEVLANRAQVAVIKSIKIVASTGCPTHPTTITCPCPAAMATMAPSDHLFSKRIWCCMTFENEILNKTHAWNYTGSLESHDAFIAAEGVTPKHFIRKQLEGDVMKLFLAPASKLNDTIQAMLELWIVRNKQWREKYGSQDIAQKKWRKEAYPDAPMETVPIEAAPDAKPGDVVEVRRLVPSQVVKMESQDRQHSFAATFTKSHPSDREGKTPYGVCVEKVEYCHEQCQVGKWMFEMNLQQASKIALDLLDKRQGEVRYE